MGIVSFSVLLPVWRHGGGEHRGWREGHGVREAA